MQQQQQQNEPWFVQVGQQFLAHYYQTMQSDRQNLRPLYQEKSCMTFEGAQVQGCQAIIDKLVNLTFKSVQHSITTCDCQPVFDVDGGEAVFICVMGQLKTDDDPPNSFTQSFLLRKAVGNYYIANETFRLVMHNVA